MTASLTHRQEEAIKRNLVSLAALLAANGEQDASGEEVVD